MTGLAFDDDRAAAHTVARALADRAANDNDAATHSGDLSCQRAAQTVACGTAYLENACLHAGGGRWACIAEHRKPAPGHQTPGLNADIALDQELASVHRLTDIIEPIAGALNVDLFDIASAYSKHVTDPNALTGCLQFDSFDIAGCLIGEDLRHERRKIKTLIGSLAKR
jgi:hypothetical protein